MPKLRKDMKKLARAGERHCDPTKRVGMNEWLEDIQGSKEDISGVQTDEQIVDSFRGRRAAEEED